LNNGLLKVAQMFTMRARGQLVNVSIRDGHGRDNPVHKSLILEHVDVESLAVALADIIAKRIESMLVARQRRLVDRPTMAELANIGTATLDRLVSSKRVPSVLVGTRRLFDPDKVIDALAENRSPNNEPM
jgi:hypothetical protein